MAQFLSIRWWRQKIADSEIDHHPGNHCDKLRFAFKCGKVQDRRGIAKDCLLPNRADGQYRKIDGHPVASRKADTGRSNDSHVHVERPRLSLRPTIKLKTATSERAIEYVIKINKSSQ